MLVSLQEVLHWCTTLLNWQCLWQNVSITDYKLCHDSYFAEMEITGDHWYFSLGVEQGVKILCYCVLLVWD